MKGTKKKDLLIFGISSIVLVVIIILVNIFVGGPMVVDGDSMNPYLRHKDLVIVDKMCYKSSEPKRFDIIVFPYNEDKGTKFVKRIIGLPGEILELKDNKIYITYNGETTRIYEYYGQYEGMSINSVSNYGPVTIGQDEYFVLGDNRYHSSDSRQEEIGLVKKDDIIGKVTFRIFPLDGFGGLSD